MVRAEGLASSAGHSEKRKQKEENKNKKKNKKRKKKNKNKNKKKTMASQTVASKVRTGKTRGTWPISASISPIHCHIFKA